MSLKKSEKTETNRYELEFSIEKDVFEAAVEKVYRKNVKNMTVPGFRKGKAPRHIIEKMYGKGVFFEDAVNACIPDAYEAAVKEAGLDTVGQPEFDVVSVDGDVILKAAVYVKPEVKISDYLGIPAAKTVKPVTDADVDAEVEATRNRNGRLVEVTDRAAENGDTVTIDFDGYTDGKQFDGGKAEGYDLKLGSGQFIPGFEDQIVGKNTGDEFDVNVKFPEDYQAEELKGKDATFKVKLHAIKKTELPELDDEFAKDVSEFNTLDEYKADVKAKIESRNDRAAENDFENALVDALIEKLDAEIPEPMFAAETENFVRDYDNRLRMQGLDLQTYFKYTGMTLDEMRKQMRPQAEKQVKVRLALEKIAELEAITVDDKAVEDEYERIAKAYNMSSDEVKGMVDRAGIEADLKVKAAMDLVKEKAVAPKKTAKKATAKSSDAKADDKADDKPKTTRAKSTKTAEKKEAADKE